MAKQHIPINKTIIPTRVIIFLLCYFVIKYLYEIISIKIVNDKNNPKISTNFQLLSIKTKLIVLKTIT